MTNEEIIGISEQYDRWYKQLEDLTSRWGKVGILKGLKDEYHQRTLAVLMENQRLINELVIETKDEDVKTQTFRRLSIPLVRRVFGNAPFMDWVGVQPMLGPTGDLFMKDINGGWMGDAKAAKTRLMKTEWPQATLDAPHKCHTNLDYEAEITAMLAIELADELCHEVIKDLCNNCTTETIGIAGSSSQPRAINNAVSYSSNKLRQNLGRHYANWMVVSEKMMDLMLSDPAYGLTGHDDLVWSSVSRVFYVGVLESDYGKIKVYCDRDMADEKVLLGYRGDWQEAGYFYMPYVFLTRLPKTPLADGTEKYGLMTRYGKFLKRGGSNYYRLVTINNVVFPQDEPELAEAGEVRSTCTLRVQAGELAGDAPDQPAELTGPGELVPEGVLLADDDGDDCGGCDSVGCHVKDSTAV